MMTKSEERDVIVSAIAANHRMCVKEIVGPSRIAHVVKARHEAMAVIRALYPEMSLPMIAHRFGRSDHSTAMWGIAKHLGWVGEFESSGRRSKNGCGNFISLRINAFREEITPLWKDYLNTVAEHKTTPSIRRSA